MSEVFRGSGAVADLEVETPEIDDVIICLFVLEVAAKVDIRISASLLCSLCLCTSVCPAVEQCSTSCPCSLTPDTMTLALRMTAP